MKLIFIRALYTIHHMNTVTIPKKEYHNLLDARLRYQYVRHLLVEDVFSPPPTKKRAELMRALKTTKKYPPRFLKSIERGLKRSPYFQ